MTELQSPHAVSCSKSIAPKARILLLCSLALTLALGSIPAKSADQISIGIEGSPAWVKLSFQGSLQTSRTPNGPFATLAQASSPYVVSTTGNDARYWRTRRRDLTAPANQLGQTLSAATLSSAAIREDGHLWVWPDSQSASSVKTPTPFGGEQRWKAVSSSGGYGHTLAIDAEGGLWSWGSNKGGELGIGVASLPMLTPQRVAPNDRWVWISAGPSISAAIRSDGSLWTWGTNQYHRLGYDTATSSLSPRQVGNETGWVEVAAGIQHMLAIRSDGTLWAWGVNANAQLGSGPKADRILPEEVRGFSPCVSAAARGNMSVAVKRDGSLWWWGTLVLGGSSTPIARITNQAPAQLRQEIQWKAVASGFGDTCAALDATGGLWTWGPNDITSGIMGDRAVAGTNAPTPLDTNQVWKAVSLSQTHGLALRSDGTLWSWGTPSALGLEDLGQLGAWAPVVLSTSDSEHLLIATRFRNNHSIDSYGRLWAWGQQSGFWSPQPRVIAEGCSWRAMECGYFHGLGIDTSGQLWTWGSNQQGQLGMKLPPGAGGTIDRPENISPGTTWNAIGCGANHSLGIQSDGSLWTWGANDEGQLGLGTVSNSSQFPQRVTGATLWQAVAAGESHSLAIDSAGHLWAWGKNEFGQLGNQSTQRSTSPVPIGGDSTWKAVAAGTYHSLAVRSDGTLWGWGRNENFQAGPTRPPNGPAEIHQPSPISSDTDWVSISGGSLHSLGLKSDGSLWAWGASPSIVLGNDSTIPGVPARVAGNHLWKAAAAGNTFSIALRQDGVVMAWGNGSTGQLGLSPLRPILTGDVWGPDSP